MAEFKSLVPAASLYVNALQQHGQNIMQAGQMIGQARQDRFRQELDMQKSNQRMDSAFKRYQVMSKIDPIIAAEDFFGSTAEDFDGNVMERLNVGKERYADFTKDMNAITKMYMDAESKGTQFNRETKEALNVGFNTLFSKYPRRQEEIAKNIENLGKISETLFPEEEPEYRTVGGDIVAITDEGVETVFEGKETEQGKSITVSPGQSVIDQSGKLIYEAPTSSDKEKGVVIPAGSRYITPEGTIIDPVFKPQEQKPIVVNPGQRIIDSSGKTLFTAPSEEKPPRDLEEAIAREKDFEILPLEDKLDFVRKFYKRTPQVQAADKTVKGRISSSKILADARRDAANLLADARKDVAKIRATKKPTQTLADTRKLRLKAERLVVDYALFQDLNMDDSEVKEYRNNLMREIEAPSNIITPKSLPGKYYK
jgi:hypothetical protein